MSVLTLTDCITTEVADPSSGGMEMVDTVPDRVAGERGWGTVCIKCLAKELDLHVGVTTYGRINTLTRQTKVLTAVCCLPCVEMPQSRVKSQHLVLQERIHGSLHAWLKTPRPV